MKWRLQSCWISTCDREISNSSSFNVHAPSSEWMKRLALKVDQKLNTVLLFLSGLAFLVAIGLMFAEGISTAAATLGILLVVILVAAIPVRS